MQNLGRAGRAGGERNMLSLRCPAASVHGPLPCTLGRSPASQVAPGSRHSCGAPGTGGPRWWPGCCLRSLRGRALFGGEGVFRREGRTELCHPPRSNASPSSPRCKQSQRLALGGPQLPGPGDGRIFADVDNGCFVRSGACVGNAALGLTQETRLLFQACVDSAGTLGPSPLPELAEPLPTFPGPAAWESQDWDSAFRSPRDANGINGGKAGRCFELLGTKLSRAP